MQSEYKSGAVLVLKKPRSTLWLLSRLTIGCLVLLTFAGANAVEDVVSDDGREIRLHDDGSWSVLSRDRFATTRDGRRIKLSPDGSWSVVSQTDNASAADASQVPATATVASQHQQAEDLIAPGSAGILLTRVDILKKKTKSHKAVTVDTRMAYYLRINNPGDQSIALNQQQVDNMVAVDSKGRRYPVLELRYDKDQISSGASEQVVLLVDGAPRWYGVKFLSLEIAGNTFGAHRKIVLSKNVNDVSTVVVDEF